MLREIYLKNYLFVPEARIKFRDGLCVITGETGAGKSVLVGAITLLFADNSQSYEAYDPDFPIYLEASFNISENPVLLSHLSALGYETEEDFIIAREIAVSGKSQYYIYGRRVSAAIVKELKALLVDFHHQRDQQKLLNPAYQMELLDHYGKLTNEVMEYRSAWQSLKKSIRLLAELRRKEEENRKLTELYQYQMEELNKAKLKADEDIYLQQDYDLLSAAKEIVSMASGIYATLFDTENSSYDMINQALAQINRYAELHPDLQEVSSQLSIALEAVEQSCVLLRDIPENLSDDAQRLEEISERLDYINNLKHKHKVKTIAELLAYLAKLHTETQHFASLEQDISALEQQIERDYKTLLQIIEHLSQMREETAVKLSVLLEQNIRFLSIPEARFEIRIDKISMDKNCRQKFLNALGDSGQDSVEFFFCANPGSAIKALNAVASGGELSRILLAIKKVLTQDISPKLLILDEIDAGIGGKTADLIASYIADIAKRHNILCITHLAQIAAYADQHIMLNKKSEHGKTQVSMLELIAEQRRIEIARMLSGNVTEYSLKHADELLES